MRRQAVRLLSGTRFERLARSGYNACRDRLPAALVSADTVKARVYDKQTIEIARRALSSGGNSIDVGANCGSILRALVKLSPYGLHWAFEPIPNLAAQLQKRFPSAKVEQIALADYSGTAQFRFLPDAAAYSSLLRRPEVENGQEVRELRVEVRTLDELIPADVNIDFVKVDVEGGEAAVFRGAAGLLRRQQPVVVFECAPAKLADCMPIFEDAGLRLWLPADFISGTPRAQAEVMRLGQQRDEFCYVASRR
jgi:FkbM family methyltransferase